VTDMAQPDSRAALDEHSIFRDWHAHLDSVRAATGSQGALPGSPGDTATSVAALITDQTAWQALPAGDSDG
jgi:hypothetical protein